MLSRRERFRPGAEERGPPEGGAAPGSASGNGERDSVAGWIRRFWHDERGLEEVEIGIVAGLIVLVGALIFMQIGNDSETTLFSLEAATSAVANAAGS